MDILFDGLTCNTLARKGKSEFELLVLRGTCHRTRHASRSKRKATRTR